MIYSLRLSWVSYLALAFFGLLFSWPTAMSCFFWAILAKQLRDHVANLPVVIAILAVTSIPLAAFMLAYMYNSFTYYVDLFEDKIVFRSGFDRYSINIEEIEKISFLSGGRGWLYIGITSRTGTGVITNAIYMNKFFNQLTEAIKELMQRKNRKELIYSGLNGPKKLGNPPFRLRHLPLYMTGVVGIAAIVFAISWFLSP